MTISSLSRIISPTVLLYAFLVITNIGFGFHSPKGHEPPPVLSAIDSLGFLWIIGWWLRRDSRKRGIAWVYDMGLFLYYAWPFIMPYYLLKTRGRKGLLVILGFVGVYFGAGIVGVIFRWLLVPGPG
jgi:hypothetical protein